MKILFFIFGLLTINACSFGGFQPPPPYYNWRLHNADALFPESWTHVRRAPALNSLNHPFFLSFATSQYYFYFLSEINVFLNKIMLGCIIVYFDIRYTSFESISHFKASSRSFLARALIFSTPSQLLPSSIASER